MLDLDNIYCIDCLDGMKQLDDDSVDLVLTDPPYNLGVDYGEGFNDKKGYDEYRDWSLNWFNEAKRVSKKGVVFTSGWNNLELWLTDIKYPKGIAVLYIPNQCSGSSLGGFNMWEPLLVYGSVSLKQNVFVNAIGFQKSVGNGHPCPKNIELCIKIINSFYPKPGVILDPFIGSGSFVVAARMMNISFLGFEINPEYCSIAEKRLANIPPRKLEDFYHLRESE